jgi:hypothetical protein
MSMKRTMKFMIRSSISKPTTIYPIEIDPSATVFDIKKEIQKLQTASAEWIKLYNPKNFFNELKDDLPVTSIELEEGKELWAEFRYKFDECLPREG